MNERYPGFNATELPRCTECKGFLPMNYTRTICKNCGKANRRYNKKATADPKA